MTFSLSPAFLTEIPNYKTNDIITPKKSSSSSSDDTSTADKSCLCSIPRALTDLNHHVIKANDEPSSPLSPSNDNVPQNLTISLPMPQNGQPAPDITVCWQPQQLHQQQSQKQVKSTTNEVDIPPSKKIAHSSAISVPVKQCHLEDLPSYEGHERDPAQVRKKKKRGFFKRLFCCCRPKLQEEDSSTI